MKKRIKILLGVLIMMCVIVSCDFLENKTIHVPKAIMQGKIEKRFPMTKKLLVGELTLRNPKIDFRGDRMYIETDYDATLLGNSGSSGKMYMSTKIKYDMQKENMYLIDFTFEKIVDKNGVEQLSSSKNIGIIKELISNYMATNPVYEYGKDNQNTKIKIKDMYIKDGKFFVRT